MTNKFHHVLIKKQSILVLAFAALGVVYGDIGTSVLYAVNEIFFGHGGIAVVQENVLGVISLVVWSLTLIITVKYVFFVLRADNQGEGGVFALLSLLNGKKFWGAAFVSSLLILAAGLLFGDGLITPAISVLAAVEGLNVATNVFAPYIIPLVLIILTLLFLIQYKGTEKVGKLFGPIIFVWFVTIGALGVVQILNHPEIFLAFNPFHAITFLGSIGLYRTMFVLGSVMLVVTGGEAMYADLGHFGRAPVKLSWLTVAYPALLLNYLGQGAYLLSGQAVHGGNIFYSLVPAWGLYPMVVLATFATIIASQALISGAFSLTAQSIALGLSPRFRIRYTNPNQEGQIYIPTVNWLLYAGCVVLVLFFQSSSNLAAAYGLAVAGVMMTTSLAMIPVSNFLWQWKLKWAVLLFGGFAMLEATFLASNSLKFFEGAYIPVLIGLFLFTVMTTWLWGRRSLEKAYTTFTDDRTMQWLRDLKQKLIENQGVLIDHRHLVETDRIQVFLVSPAVTMLSDRVPMLVRAYLRREGSLPKHLILLTIDQKKIPHVYADNRYVIENLGADIWSVQAKFGFMEQPEVPRILDEIHALHVIPDNLSRAIIEVGELEVTVADTNMNFLKALRVRFFRLLLKQTVPLHHYFGLRGNPGVDKTMHPVVISATEARIYLPRHDSYGAELEQANLKEMI